MAAIADDNDDSSWADWKGEPVPTDNSMDDDSWGNWRPGAILDGRRPAAIVGQSLGVGPTLTQSPIVRWTKFGRLLCGIRRPSDSDEAEKLAAIPLASLEDPSDMSDRESDKEYEDLYERETLKHVLFDERPATIVKNNTSHSLNYISNPIQSNTHHIINYESLHGSHGFFNMIHVAICLHESQTSWVSTLRGLGCSPQVIVFFVLNYSPYFCITPRLESNHWINTPIPGGFVYHALE